jgi:hypothetical protein
METTPVTAAFGITDCLPVKVINRRSSLYQQRHICREESTLGMVKLTGGGGGKSRIADAHSAGEGGYVIIYIVMKWLDGGELFRGISTTGE